MEVTLLGTGDTTGTPTVQCDCDTCERARDPDEELRARVRERGIDPTGGVERSRFSVALRNDATGESLLVDLSPDFRHQTSGSRSRCRTRPSSRTSTSTTSTASATPTACSTTCRSTPPTRRTR